MTAQQINKSLNNFASGMLEVIHSKMQVEEIKPENSNFLEIKSLPPDLSFKISQYEFVIKTEIRPYAGTIYIRTYEIVDDLNVYPNKKLNHIEEMDIVGYLNGFRRFVKSKQTEVFPGRFIPGTSFQDGSDYLYQISAFLAKRENAEFISNEAKLEKMD